MLMTMVMMQKAPEKGCAASSQPQVKFPKNLRQLHLSLSHRAVRLRPRRKQKRTPQAVVFAMSLQCLCHASVFKMSLQYPVLYVFVVQCKYLCVYGGGSGKGPSVKTTEQMNDWAGVGFRRVPILLGYALKDFF